MVYKSMTIEITWEGPFAWPGYESINDLPPILNLPGIYLQTFKYQCGYLIYAAGLTRRTIPKRFEEHTTKYMNGEYNVLDINAIQEGKRKEVWHGWSYAREHRGEFEERKSEIIEHVHKQLSGFSIFTADIGKEPRILERLEAAIMTSLYQQHSPICNIPDKGMMLASRWDTEKPIIVKNNFSVLLYGLPIVFEI